MIFALVLACVLSLQDPLLQIEVVAGEGAVHPAGSRTPSGLVVRVADSLGRPVAGALVSFRLPDDGPGGAFASGLGTEIVKAGADGRAVAPPVRWNHLHGAVEIRITAARDGRRAGAVVVQHIAAAPASLRRARSGRKWLYIAGAAAAGAVAGFTLNRSGNGRAADSPAAGVDIGTPTIVIGKP